MQIKSYSFQNISCSCSGPLWPHTTCINAMQCQCICTPSPSMQTMQPQLPGAHHPAELPRGSSPHEGPPTQLSVGLKGLSTHAYPTIRTAWRDSATSLVSTSCTHMTMLMTCVPHHTSCLMTMLCFKMP